MISLDENGENSFCLYHPHKKKVFHAVFGNFEERMFKTTEILLASAGNCR
jgi:hypothetical protein